MSNIIIDDLTIINDHKDQLVLKQKSEVFSIERNDIIHLDRNQAAHLIPTIEVHFGIEGRSELYEKAIRALMVAEAPEFSPNRDVANMDATNERKFADSTPVLLVAHIFSKKNTQVAADVIGQAREPKDV